ncbi:MAG: hypothetical protein P4K86_11025 [Terracidiphilus sp.]|nr:hypothetical protein [Terracidiphilus sp.]MDR3776571.1 hypothetical protein [Terracidiphilus sp.]
MKSGAHLGDFFSNRQEPGRADLPVMSVTMNDSLVLRDDMERRTESALRADQHLLVKKGDIAYNMMRMWQGACGLAQADGIVSPAYVVLAPKSGIDTRFAYHWFKSDRMIYLFWAFSHGLTKDRLRLYFNEFSEIPATPPTFEKQRRIVTVLDMWDQAIEQLERLIRSKRSRKIALLSHLFGKERNPFKTKGVPLDSIATVHYGKGLGTEEYTEQGLHRVYGTQGEVGRTNKKMFEGPAIIVGRKGTLDNPILVNEPVDFWAIDTTFVVRTSVDTRLLHAFLDYVDLSQLSEASGVPSLSSDNLRALMVPLDHLERFGSEPLIQVLDRDIDHATGELALMYKQKHGLMQKLLTDHWPLDKHITPPVIKIHPALAGGKA